MGPVLSDVISRQKPFFGHCRRIKKSKIFKSPADAVFMQFRNQLVLLYPGFADDEVKEGDSRFRDDGLDPLDGRAPGNFSRQTSSGDLFFFRVITSAVKKILD